MGMLVNGIWEDDAEIPSDKAGRFVRAESSFRNHVTSDGSSDFKAEANRYHLYVSYACPWASRALVMRSIKKLENVISLSVTDILLGDQGWSFSENPGETFDQVNHVNYLKEIYILAKKDYTGRVTVPLLWDKHTKTIVNNESVDIMRMLNKAFNAFTDVKEDYYPDHLKSEIDAINDFIYDAINNGVYKCGFAKSQEAYDEAIHKLFDGLNQVEKLLAKQSYLVRDQLTEADIRLFTTLVRFDLVYVGHFKCNLRRIADYPNLFNYLKKIYQIPEIKTTVHFDHIKKHYYQSQLKINPTGIVPFGPEVALG